MHTQRLTSGLHALCSAVVPAPTTARPYTRVHDFFYYRTHNVRIIFLHSATLNSNKSGTPSSPALNVPRRLFSSGTSQRPLSTPNNEQRRTGACHECKDVANAPEWVSSQKQNGEKRMSVSIRCGAQRQLARRSPNVPPHAPLPPPPPASSVHPSLTVTQGERDTTPSSRTVSHMRNSSIRSCPHSQHQIPQDTANTLTAPGSCSFVANDVSSPLPLQCTQLTTTLPSSFPSATGTQSNISHTRTNTTPTAKTPVHPAAIATSYTSQEDGGAAASGSVYTTTSSSHPLLYSVSRFTEPVKRIILIRNGRSEANEDVAAYVHTPDWRIPLVEEGKHESIAAGRALSELTGDDPVYFYYSPYIRSRQSLRYVLQGYDEARLSGRSHPREWWEEEEEGSDGSGASVAEDGGVSCTPYPNGGGSAELGGLPLETAGIATTSASDAGLRGGVLADTISTDPTTDTASATFLQKEASLVLDSVTSDNIIGVREDVRLRDGDIGRYTTVDELMHHLLERERYGKFFYRFPYGESGADVCDRVTSFLDAFQRERVEFPMDTNVVIITHGLTMRMFIKRWFHLTVETFHRMKSPPPGSLCTLTRLHHRSCFRLDESCVELMHLPLSLNEYNGYKYRNKQLLGSMSSGAPYM